MANSIIVIVVGIAISLIYFVWQQKNRCNIKRKRKIERKRITEEKS